MKINLITLLYLLLFVNCLKAQVWKELGPTNEPLEDGGYTATGIGVTTCLRFSPDYNQTSRLYCGSASGGLWVSNNDGTSWLNMNTDQLSNLGVSDVAPHPTNSNIIFMATGFGFGNSNGFEFGISDPWLHFSDGVYKTTNATSISNGKYNCAWNKVGNWFKDSSASILIPDFWSFPSYKTIHRLMIDPQAPEVIFALIDKGYGAINDSCYIYRSSDGGANWLRVFEAKGDALIDMEFAPNNHNIIYVTTLKSVLSSYTNGTTWTKINSKFVDGNSVSLNIKVAARPTDYNRLEVAICQAEPNVVLVCYFFADTIIANKARVWYFDLYKSNDSGSTFSILQTTHLFAGDPYYNGAGGRAGFAVSQLNSNNVAIGENSCDVSLDGGNSIINNAMSGYSGYNLINSNHPDIHFLNFSPIDNKKIFVCHDGGLSYGIIDASQVGLNRFRTTKIYDGLGIRRSMCLSSSQQDESIFVESGWDCGHNYVNLSSGSPFHTKIGGDGTYSTMDYMDDQTYGFADAYNDYYELYKGSNVFTGGGFGLLNFHPTNHNKLFFWERSTGNFYLEDLTNRTSGSLISTSPLSSGNTFNAFSVCQTNPNIIYAVWTNNGQNWSGLPDVFKSIDGGIKFTPLTSLTSQYVPTDVVVNPYNENQSWVCFAHSSRKVMMTLDGGASWTDFSAGLPPEALCRSIIFVEGTSGLIYLGTQEGVYFFDMNSNTSWQKLGTELPNTNVNKMTYLPKFNKLRVATVGRGIWELDINKCIAVVNDGVSENQSVPIILDADLVWEMPVRLKTDLIIPLGRTLTIRGEVYMSPNARIKVFGKLVLDGAKITSGCNNEMWYGITAFGNSALDQNINTQCVVICKNITEISNSKVGIESIDGAIVRVTDSYFFNNRRSLFFSQYHTTKLQSWVKNSVFRCTGPLQDPIYNGVGSAGFITLWDNEGLVIEDNIFENTAPNGIYLDHDRGYGIYSVDASYSVSKGFLVGTVLDPNSCNVPNGPGNQFTGLTKGIYANAYSFFGPIKILNNQFTNCTWSILMNGTEESKIYKNSVEVNDFIDPTHYDINNCITCNNGLQQMTHFAPDEIIGIGLDDCTNFFIDQNSIVRKTNLSSNINGIYVNSSHYLPNGNSNRPKIFNNSVAYSGTSLTALPTVGTLIVNNNPELEIECNSYNLLKYDWLVALNGGVLKDQGSFNQVIKNTWTPCTYAVDNIEGTAGSPTFTYFSNPADAPLCYTFCMVSTPNLLPNCQATDICYYFPAPLLISEPTPEMVPLTPKKVINVIVINPNPAGKITTINFSLTEIDKGSTDFELINNLGISVYKNKVESQNGSFNINLENFINGIYTLRVLNNSKIIAQQNLLIVK